MTCLRRSGEDESQNRQEADFCAQQDTDDERRVTVFVGTEHCGLCRMQLPWGNLSGLEAWQCAFRAGTVQPDPYVSALSDSCVVISLDSNNEDSVELTGLASFSNVHSDEVNVKLTGHRHSQEITIVRCRQNKQRIHSGRMAFCFHNWCYELLMWNVRSCTKSEIYRLSRTLSLSQLATENGCGNHGLLGSISDDALRWLEEQSSCRIYPFILSQLPTELRRKVWEYVGSRVASNAFALVERGTSLLVSALNSSQSRSISLDQGSFISLKMITVFGTTYLQDLGNREGSKAIPGVVKRLIFAMSFNGICAIKLFGINWDTAWLGEIPNNECIWYGSLEGIGSTLTCTYNVS
jgi:hypothetical protein